MKTDFLMRVTLEVQLSIIFARILRFNLPMYLFDNAQLQLTYT